MTESNTCECCGSGGGEKKIGGKHYGSRRRSRRVDREQKGRMCVGKYLLPKSSTFLLLL